MENRFKIITYLGKKYSVPITKWEEIENKPTIPDEFIPSDHDLDEFLNDNVDPFAKLSDIIVAPGSPVTSVNTLTGDIVLNQDNILDGTVNKQYSLTEKNKLAAIANGAEVNVNADWNSVSGDSQILNKPTITTPVNADWNSVSGLSQVLNKPTIPTNFTVRDSFGIVILGGSNLISLGYKNIGKIKSSGIITSYNIESYEENTNNAIVGSISINVKKNGTLIGNIILSSQSTNTNSVLSGWTTSVTKDDKIQYEVLSNTNIKNITLTLFFNHSTI